MLYTLAVILLIAWLLGMVGTYTIGAFIHVLLVVAIVLFLVRPGQRSSHGGLEVDSCKSECESGSSG